VGGTQIEYVIQFMCSGFNRKWNFDQLFLNFIVFVRWGKWVNTNGYNSPNWSGTANCSSRATNYGHTTNN